MQNILFQLFIKALVVFTCLPFHECAHAWAAHKMGDDTAKNQGRLTINPLAHLDIVGALSLMIAGIGWAKPVPVNPRNFKNPKRGMMLSSLAGPGSNILLALVLLVVYKLLFFSPLLYNGFARSLINILAYMIQINLSLAVFNLLPVPPLDGSRLATYFLPQKYYFKLMQYEHIIFIALFLLLATGILSVPISFLSGLLLDGLDFITRPLDLLARFLFMR